MRNIEFLNVPVGQLRKNPWNTNKVTPGNEAKIRASLERNGMFKPIIVRQVEDVPGFEILGGEHRWEQAIAIGAEEVPIANLGFISDKQAKEIGVIDNSRYGADDTLSFAELLKELGDVDELQGFLPLGSADLDAIFSASTIALDALEIDENFERDLEQEEEVKPTKAPKTHIVMRFKLSLGDAERLTALIAKTQKSEGYTSEDDLTNAGDALVHLLSGSMTTSPVAFTGDEELEAMMDAALKDDAE
jgi:hypothetical protein